MPKTARQLTVFPVTLREAEVVRVADVTSGMRRITLTGSQLRAFTSASGYEQPEFVSPGFDDDIRLIFPYPGETEPVLPTQGDGKLIWPKEPRPLAKVYTVRRWDPAAGELDVDFVKHGVGVATTWAYRAKAGDRIHFFGPAASRSLPDDADWMLIAGDDTAIPAIARMLEELPETAQAQVLIEIAEDSHRQQLRELPGVSVTWLSRQGAEPGTTTLLLDAIKQLDWPQGTPFAWIGGEQATVRDLRRYLIEHREMAKEQIFFSGYWKRSTVVALEDDAALPDPGKTTPAFETFHDYAELVPPIAIRVAAGLRLGDLISRGVTSVVELAEQTGSDQRALGKLLRYLHSIDLLAETTTGRYRLTETGEFLANEFWTEMLDPSGAEGRMEAGIYGLAESIRTGEPAYASVTGRTFSQVRSDPEFVNQHLERTAQAANFIAGPIAASPVLKNIEHLEIRSAGAVVEAREITAAHPNIRVTISVPAAEAEWMRRDLPVTIPDARQRDRVNVIEQVIHDDAPAADAVLIVHELASLTHIDAVAALRAAEANLNPGGRILLIERTFNTAKLDEHDGEADLIALTREGAGLPTEDELTAVIQAAGLALAGTHTIGWGTTLRELTSTA